MLRGNGGQDIFFAKGDRRRLHELLARIEQINNTIIQA